MIKIFTRTSLLLSMVSILSAEGVSITPQMHVATFVQNGKEYTIKKEQREGQYLNGEFSLTSRPTPQFFIQPFKVSDDVETYAELEAIDFLTHNGGIFIDARLSNWYEMNHIPGSVNVPFKIFLSDSPERDKVLKDWGGKKLSDNKSWDFSNAKTLLFYCNGAWCAQSPTAIRALIELGYPEKKMKYYRGGMQSWLLAGLSVDTPKKENR